ncbi:MAG: metal-dependent phosphohydrolase [Bacteroidetes bacterium]|nr:MAG: metal-dependent phosphohydrolase [Bacteroidota bacterium]
MMEEKEDKNIQKDTGFAQGRGKETLFRVSARNQIELIAIADNKANIIIGINVMLITLIIASFGSNFELGDSLIMSRMELLIPFSILLFCCLISAIFSMLAAKPHIIKSKEKKGSSKLFFQNFYTETLDEYKADMYKVLGSRQLTYDQMIIDMYHNGIVLHGKYNLLSKSYNVFMFGQVATVLAYVITSFVI